MVKAQLAVVEGRRLDRTPDLASRQGRNSEGSALEVGLGVGAIHPDRTEGME
jgi:hypothetical protein